MFRSFQYRLRPTRKQEAILDGWLRLTRELYNAALQERRDAWRKQRVSVTRLDQEKQLAEIRQIRPEFGAAVSTAPRPLAPGKRDQSGGGRP